MDGDGSRNLWQLTAHATPHAPIHRHTATPSRELATRRFGPNFARLSDSNGTQHWVGALGDTASQYPTRHRIPHSTVSCSTVVPAPRLIPRATVSRPARPAPASLVHRAIRRDSAAHVEILHHSLMHVPLHVQAADCLLHVLRHGASLRRMPRGHAVVTQWPRG